MVHNGRPSLSLSSLLNESKLCMSEICCFQRRCVHAFGPDGDGRTTVEVLAPNANLLIQGIPQIPMRLARSIQRYTDFRGHGLLEFHPTTAQVLVLHRAPDASTTQLFLAPGPLSPPEQLTFTSDPISNATFQPKAGGYVVFVSATGGDEANQLFHLDLGSRIVSCFSDPSEKHSFVSWMHGQPHLLYSSVPLDKTAAAGTRSELSTRITLVDPERPVDSVKQIANLPGATLDI
jgi:hypothetical protein